MPIYRANDKYSAQLRTTWISSPADTTLGVTAIPSNMPTIVVIGYGTATETVFSATGTSGTSSSNYALTGVARIKGANTNLAINSTVNCINVEDFFNQYETVVGGLTDMYDTSGLQLTQISTPSSPVAGKDKLYFKTDENLYRLTVAGVEKQIANNIEAIVTATDGSTVTFNLSGGKKQNVVLGGNRTLALSNASTGLVFILSLTQDGSGGRTVTWFSTIRWAGGVAPVLTTTLNKRDTFGFICTGSNTYDGFVIGSNI